MDRDLPDSLKLKRKYKLIGTIAIWAVVFFLMLLLLRFTISPKINRSEFYTAYADNGMVEATMTASGTVLPEFEETKTSPIQSSIVKIYSNTGDKVHEGDSVL